MDLAKLLGLQVISLTEELLATAKQSEDSGVDVLTTVGAYPDFHHDQVTSQHVNMNIF